ncbi:MAG: MFS transporter [Sphingomonas fennica]
MTEAAGRWIEVRALLDRQPIGGFHRRIVALSTLLMLIDGFDVFMIGKLAPAIAAGFGETPAAMARVFLFQQIGLAIGAFAMGPLADARGRKAVLMLSMAVFGTLTLAIPFARTLGEVAVLRGVSSVFLGGVVPNVCALMAELCPARRRSTFLSILFVGYSAGGAGGALVAAFLLDRYGWQSGFWIGGTVPLVLLLLYWRLVPESPQVQARRNPHDPRIARTLMRLEPDPALLDAAFYNEEDRGAASRPRVGPAALFTDGRLPSTMLLWAANLLSMANIALLGAWMPTFFQEMGGISIQRFALVSMLTFAGGITGTMSIGPLMDRMRPHRVLAAIFLLNAVALAAIGHLPFGTVAFAVALTLTGFSQSGGQAGLNAIVAGAYPAAARATGFSWAGGAGRIGGVIAPLLGGLALSSHLALGPTFLFIALPPLGVIVAVLALERLTRRG